MNWEPQQNHILALTGSCDVSKRDTKVLKRQTEDQFINPKYGKITDLSLYCVGIMLSHKEDRINLSPLFYVSEVQGYYLD